MQARVKPGYRWPTLLAFGGHEFSKRDWSTVPPDFEAEALKHEDLEIFGGVSVETPKEPKTAEKQSDSKPRPRPRPRPKTDKRNDEAPAKSDTPTVQEDPGDEEPKPEEPDEPDASEGGA